MHLAGLLVLLVYASELQHQFVRSGQDCYSQARCMTINQHLSSYRVSFCYSSELICCYAGMLRVCTSVPFIIVKECKVHWASEAPLILPIAQFREC